MKNSRPDLFVRPIFIIALALLLLNDFFLKYEFSNFFTGKLSDFAGLFLFPYFLSSIKIKWTKIIYPATALLFIFWKSELCQTIIDWIQLMGIGVDRVVDYTDLIALIVLPLSYFCFQHEITKQPTTPRFLSIPMSALGLFAICATTLPKKQIIINKNVNEVYTLNMSKAKLFQLIKAGHGYSDTLKKNMQDSLFYFYYDIDNGYRAKATALVKINSVKSNTTKIFLEKIIQGELTGRLTKGVNEEELEHFKSLTEKEFKAFFEKNVIRPLEIGSPTGIYFDNKEIEDLNQ